MYGLKAPISDRYLLEEENRQKEILCLDQLALEIHTFGNSDIYSSMGRDACLANKDLIQNYDWITVHIAQPTLGGEVFDIAKHGLDQIIQMMEFARALDAQAINIHRQYGINQNLTYTPAEQGFNEAVLKIDRLAEDYSLITCIENFGYGWLPASFAEENAFSPLDFFFPYELTKFRGFLKENSLKNIWVTVDIAHAVEACNSYFFYNTKLVSVDKANLFAHIANINSPISPEMWIEAAKPEYIHLSDAFLARDKTGLKASDFKKYYRTDRQIIGEGNLDYNSICEAIKRHCPSNAILIAEITGAANQTNSINNLRSRGLI